MKRATLAVAELQINKPLIRLSGVKWEASGSPGSSRQGGVPQGLGGKPQ